MAEWFKAPVLKTEQTLSVSRPEKFASSTQLPVASASYTRWGLRVSIAQSGQEYPREDFQGVTKGSQAPPDPLGNRSL
jgi:hypothetical protein